MIRSAASGPGLRRAARPYHDLGQRSPAHRRVGLQPPRDDVHLDPGHTDGEHALSRPGPQSNAPGGVRRGQRPDLRRGLLERAREVRQSGWERSHDLRVPGHVIRAAPSTSPGISRSSRSVTSSWPNVKITRSTLLANGDCAGRRFLGLGGSARAVQLHAGHCVRLDGTCSSTTPGTTGSNGSPSVAIAMASHGRGTATTARRERRVRRRELATSTTRQGSRLCPTARLGRETSTIASRACRRAASESHRRQPMHGNADGSDSVGVDRGPDGSIWVSDSKFSDRCRCHNGGTEFQRR